MACVCYAGKGSKATCRPSSEATADLRDSKPHRDLVFVQVGDILRKRVQGSDVQFRKTTGSAVE